jgi:hypothetical protein
MWITLTVASTTPINFLSPPSDFADDEEGEGDETFFDVSAADDEFPMDDPLGLDESLGTEDLEPRLPG